MIIVGVEKWYVVAAILSIFFLFAFVPVSFASHDEFLKIRNDIWSKGKRWVAEETEISKLADHERKKRLGLLKPLAAPEIEAPAAPAFTAEASQAPPATFDWRNFNGKNYVTGIRNQGNCGSCWAFATTAALESNVLITSGADYDLSEQILISCGNAGSCSGGYPTTASSFIRDTGNSAESYYTYTATNGACANALAGWQNATSRITTWHYVGNTTNPTLDQIKSELFTYGPLVTTMDVYSDFYYYNGGVYQHTSGSYQGGHAVLIVGYDDDGQYLVVKNSWGSNWGEAGYFRIGYSELNSTVNFGDWSLAYYSRLIPLVLSISSFSP
jgi:C1A family cysteine protease